MAERERVVVCEGEKKMEVVRFCGSDRRLGSNE
jgi:hypothetical protein